MELPGVLVIVHPGSLCGSLEMHCPRYSGVTRILMTDEICNWMGNVAVIDHDLSDELATYMGLAAAVERAEVRVQGLPTERGLTNAARKIARALKIHPNTPIRLTGAWRDFDGTGCVTAVDVAFRREGFRNVTISRNCPSSDRDQSPLDRHDSSTQPLNCGTQTLPGLSKPTACRSRSR